MAEISELETRKSGLEDQLNQLDQDYKLLEQLSHELNVTINKLDEITNRWLELSERL